MSKIPLRKRIFLAVEGEGEQSFVKWLQELSDQNGLHVHLDCQPLSGGGYRSMLGNAIRQQERKGRKKIQSILLVDADRAKTDDSWSIEKLKQEAAKYKFNVIVQNPNQEGIFFRMFPKYEDSFLDATAVKKQLIKLWPEYDKPIDARTLASKFSFDDLLRMARKDLDLQKLLQLIGFKT